MRMRPEKETHIVDVLFVRIIRIMASKESLPSELWEQGRYACSVDYLATLSFTRIYSEEQIQL